MRTRLSWQERPSLSISAFPVCTEMCLLSKDYSLCLPAKKAHLYSCSLLAMTSLRNSWEAENHIPHIDLGFSKRYTDHGRSYWRSMKEGRFPHESFWPHVGLPNYARSHQSPVRTGV